MIKDERDYKQEMIDERIKCPHCGKPYFKKDGSTYKSMCKWHMSNAISYLITERLKGLDNSEKIIELANDLMEDFRINGKIVNDYGKHYIQNSRLGILKTDVEFDLAIKIIEESLELLKREYEIEYSNLGMYYTIKKEITDN